TGSPITFTATALASSATTLDFDVQPTNTVAGETITPGVTVRLEDDYGNLVSSATNAVILELTNPNGATLEGTLSVNAINGIATFNDLTVDLSGTYTLTARAVGTTDAVS